MAGAEGGRKGGRETEVHRQGPDVRPRRPRELVLHPTSHRKTLEDFNMARFVLKSKLWQL